MLYNVGLISAIHQHELAMSIYMSPRSWTSLPPPTFSYPFRLLQSSSLSCLSHTANLLWLHVSFWINFFFLLDIYPGLGLLNHLVALFLVFWGPSILFFTVAAPVHPPVIQGGSLFCTATLAFVVCRLFNDGHSDQCEMVPHCNFDLHFFSN